MKTPTTLGVLVAGLVLVTGAVAVASPQVGTPTHGSGDHPLTVDTQSDLPHSGVLPVAQRKLPPSATITLVTGDRIRLDPTPDGRQSVTPLRSAPDGATQPASAKYVQFTWSGDQYVLPTAAVPYLSATLDPRLFDVSYLVRAGLDDAHSPSVPVRITTSGGTSAASLPATHVTTSSGDTATATITKAQAGQFGHLLAEQWRSSRAAGSSTPTGRLPGVSHVALAPPAGAPALPATPPGTTTQAALAGTAGTAGTASTHGGGLHYRTVTLDSIDLNGDRGTMVGEIHNVDDGRINAFVLEYPGQQGPVSFSVPDGTYSIEVSVLTGPSSDLSVDMALVVKPEVTISSDTTITLDARTATPYQPTLQTPPAGPTQRVDLLTYTRTATTGPGMKVQAFGFDGLFAILWMHLYSAPESGNRPLAATPTPAVTKGTFDFNAITEIAGSEFDVNPAPRYLLTFPNRGGIPSSLTYPVSDADLAAIHSRIQDNACQGCTAQTELFSMMFLPWSQNELGVGALVPTGDRTDYFYSSAPELTLWQRAFNANDGTRRWSARQRLNPGQQVNEVWDKAPVAPALASTYVQGAASSLFGGGDQASGPLVTVCAACRQDDNGMLYLNALGDSDPTHYGDAKSVVDQSTLRFYRDDVLALTSDGAPSGTTMPSAVFLPMLRRAATYRLQWTWSSVPNLETSSDTVWTFHSAPTDPAAAPPDTEKCAPDLTRSCSFLPLLFVSYDLPLNLHSQASAGGPFQLDFAVAGQANAPAPDGLSATVSLSYDDGATWTAEQVAQAGANDRFTATVTHPELAATNGFVSLRVRAHDAAGNAVEQTTIRAYALTD